MTLDCTCGHRLALHTYFKERSPCTRCRCRSFEEPSESQPRFTRKERDEEASYAASGLSSDEPERRLL